MTEPKRNSELFPSVNHKLPYDHPQSRKCHVLPQDGLLPYEVDRDACRLTLRCKSRI